MDRVERVRCTYSVGRFGSCLRGGAQVASGFPSLEVCLFWSLAYVVLRRVLELVVLFGRGERSKELEILVLRHELCDPAPAGRPASALAGGSAAIRGVQPAASSARLACFHRSTGDAVVLAPAAGSAPVDV